VVCVANHSDDRLLNTFRKAGNGLGVALFGVLITDATVAGIQDASCCLGFCSPLAFGNCGHWNSR